MKSARYSRLLGCTAIVALVAGCGGGADGGQPAQTNAPGTFNVQAVVSAMYQRAASYEMTGVVSINPPVTLRDVDTIVPGLWAEGQPGSAATQVNHKVDPVPITLVVPAPYTGSEMFYFTPDPFRLLTRTRPDARIEHFTVTADLPTSATIGESGELGQFTLDGTVGTSTLRWNVQPAEVAGMAWVCLVFDYYGGSVQSRCARVDADGAILGRRLLNELGSPAPSTADIRSALP